MYSHSLFGACHFRLFRRFSLECRCYIVPMYFLVVVWFFNVSAVTLKHWRVRCLNDTTEMVWSARAHEALTDNVITILDCVLAMLVGFASRVILFSMPCMLFPKEGDMSYGVSWVSYANFSHQRLSIWTQVSGIVASGVVTSHPGPPDPDIT